MSGQTATTNACPTCGNAKRPCPVCAGAGYWYRSTGSPCWTRPVPDFAMRCPYCEGSGKAPEVRDGRD